MTTCFATIDDFPANPRKAVSGTGQDTGRLAPFMRLMLA